MKGAKLIIPAIVIILFGSPNWRMIAWLTSLTIITDKNANTPIAMIIPPKIFPAFI